MDKRSLSPKDLARFTCVGEPKISPNGKNLAYVRQRVDEGKEKYLTDIFLMDLDSKSTRQLTTSGKDRNPAWSKDGKHLAFVSDRSEKSQIWVIDIEGGEAWQIPTKEKIDSGPWWSQDGRTIFYGARVFSKPSDWIPYPGCPEDDRERSYEQAKRVMEQSPAEDPKKKESEKKPNDIKVITRLRYRMDGLGYFGDLRNQVFYVPFAENSRETAEQKGIQLTSGDFDHGLGAISPCGDFALVTSSRREDADYLLKNDIWLIHIKTGKEWLLYDSPGPVSSVRWSPDGKWVSFFGHNNRKNVSTRLDLFMLKVGDLMEAAGDSLKSEGSETMPPLTEKDATNLTASLDRQAGGFIGSDIRFGGSENAKWDKDALYFSLEDHGAVYIYRAFPSRDGKWDLEKVYGSETEAISSFDVCSQRLVIQASNPTETENLYLLNLDQNPIPSKLTYENEKFLADIGLGDFEKFKYKATDGQELDGWIVYPCNFRKGEKYPLVVTIHGGPHGAYGSAFLFSAQLFASRGYAVAYFNPRGSTSYGEDFMSCIDGDWGNKDYSDIMDGVSSVISRGFIDENRLFVFGWSYGGYMTTWIVTKTSRFKAACSGAPVTDLLSDYGTTDIMWADEHEYGGKPWEKATLLLSRSPLANVANVTTPLLMLHGENDLRCPIIQSEEFYVALKRLGKTAVFVRYPGEFHGLRRLLHKIDRFKRMLAWFDYYSRL